MSYQTETEKIMKRYAILAALALGGVLLGVAVAGYRAGTTVSATTTTAS